MVQSGTPTTDYNPHSDDIDLFGLFETLWAHKIFIVLVTLVFALAGLAYATYKPRAPDTYTARAVLEVASYVTSTGQIVALEPGGDLAQVISQTAEVRAQLLRGSNNLVELYATHLRPEEANQSLLRVLDSVVKRHQAVGQQIGEGRLIRPTAMIGVITIQKQSLPDKKTAIVVVSVMLGLVFASIAILFRKFYIQRKQRAEGRVE